MGDPFLNYFALFLLIFVVVVLFYGIIAIHDIPYKIAEARHHPHQDAIHAAGWVSLFTLHALWPFLWIWAMAYRPERGWGFSTPPAPSAVPAGGSNEAPPKSDSGELSPTSSSESSPKGGSSGLPATTLSELQELRRRIDELEKRARTGEG